MPRCGRSHDRRSDHTPSMVLTWTSQKPSPSSVPGILAVGMADCLVRIAPGLQTGIDVILVGVDLAPRSDRGGDGRLDRPLLHIGQHAHDQLATTLDQPEDGRFVLLQRAASRRTRQAAPAPEPPLLATAAGWPLWPATT